MQEAYDCCNFLVMQTQTLEQGRDMAVPVGDGGGAISIVRQKKAEDAKVVLHCPMLG